MREARLLAAVDPGRSKCGVVLADPLSRTVLAAAILSPEEARGRIAQWQQQGMASVVLGNGTGSTAWHHHLRQLGLTVLLVNEHGTTLAARERYWDLEGRRHWHWHWQRWLPAGLRLPPRAIDDVVAQLLLERHLGCTLARATGPLRTGPGP